MHLGPVTITGGNITNARAALSGGSQSVAEWLVNFELDGEGTQKFADATRLAVNQPPPQNQIAIAVDRKIISNPVVQSADHRRAGADHRRLHRAGARRTSPRS